VAAGPTAGAAATEPAPTDSARSPDREQEPGAVPLPRREPGGRVPAQVPSPRDAGTGGNAGDPGTGTGWATDPGTLRRVLAGLRRLR
jgi:hypothetical protein